MDQLAPLSLPARPDEWLPWVSERASRGLADAGAQVAALKAAAPGDAAILELWNDVRLSLSNVFAVSALMTVVHPDPAVMEEAERRHIEAQSFSTDLYLDTVIHHRLGSLDAEALDAPARRYLQDALLAFRRSGVDRDEATRERLRELNHRESELTQSFARGIRDGRRTTRLAAADLAGLPADYVEDHPPGDDGLVAISTDYPDTLPFLTHASSPAARTAVLHSLLNVGWPDNDAVLAELLEVREQKAHLLGYDDWPSFDAEVKMIGSGPAIAAFIDDLAEATDEAGRREIEQLLEYARREGEDVIDFANWRHHLETLKRERFDVDAQQLRRYFDFRKVRQGLLDVTGRLFGLAYEEVDAPAWHPDVASYDVRLVETGELLGRIHLDLNPRPRKYNHAAQFTLVNGVLGRQLPEGVLVCNFPGGAAGDPGLVQYTDVVTFFHEFGHLLHELFAGRHQWLGVGGIRTEQDFVEAPSQMLEEWTWDPQVLQTFAKHYKTNEPIPVELVRQMKRADEFGKGLVVRRQMVYAKLSLSIYDRKPADVNTDTMIEKLTQEYQPYPFVKDTHWQNAFGHLDGYSAVYYTYMWSLVIAKDMFSQFDRNNLLAPGVAAKYRATVLAPGGAKPAAALVADFLGRPFDYKAWENWLNREES